MFKRRPSPAKKKFAAVAPAKKRRRQLDPRTVLLLKQTAIGLGLITLLLIIGVVLWYGTRIPSLTISTITASGGETIDPQAVEEAVETVLEGEYIGIVPKRFAWWYPSEAVLATVSGIPRVKQPTVDLLDGTNLVIMYDEYLPYGLWCPDRESDDCLFIDEDGYAFDEAPALKGGALPRYVTLGKAPGRGETMVGGSDLEAIEILRLEISDQLDLPIAYVESDIMRDIYLGVAGGGEIKATLRQPPGETFENLRAILDSPEFADIKPGSFQYIDLRFGNKVFVNEESVVPLGKMSSTTATTTETVEEVEE